MQIFVGDRKSTTQSMFNVSKKILDQFLLLAKYLFSSSFNHLLLIRLYESDT